MTSYRTPSPYRERQKSWEETDLISQRRHFDDSYDHPTSGYCNDTGHSLYDENEGYLENERREYIDYRDRNQDLREQDGEYRHFERENKKLSPPPLLQDFIRNKESLRDLDSEASLRESRYFDSVDEYIRQQRKLEHADVSREKERCPRSLRVLEPVILNDDRSRDHGGGLRSRDYRVDERSREYRVEERSHEYRIEERSRDRDYRSRRNDDDDYHRSDNADDFSYRRNERRSTTEELDYHDNTDPRRHGYRSEHARNDPYYQRDSRNDDDKRSEDILYGYRDRHRRCTERELRKQMDEYDSHGRAYSSERGRDRRGREFSHDDKNKHSYSSRLVKDERFTRPGMRSYDNEPQRRPEGGVPRFKGEPRRLSRDHYKSLSRHSQRQRGGTRSKSPGIPRKAHSHCSSPARKSPPFSGKAPTHEKNPKRKMSTYELNGTKRRKCDVRQPNASLKSQEIPNAQLITRDQFLSRDIFNSTKYSSRESEYKRTRSSDIAFRDCTSSRNSCGERDLRDELSDSRAAAVERKPLHFEHSVSDYEERPSTAISTRIIDNNPPAIRSIVQIPAKKFQDLHESCTKNKEEVEIQSAQVKRSITPDPVIKSRAKQVSITPNAEPQSVATSQPVRTSEVLKRKVSICSGRAPSTLLGAVEKPKVELLADDLRLLIMSRRLRQQKETTPSLDENLAEKNETLLMSPPRTEQQFQVSSERRGRTDGMVELSYSDSEASTNEESAPPAPTGHACRKVVMRRQVILDYGNDKSHPRTLHLLLDKEKGKNKLGNGKESSRNSNVVLEVVSEGMANPPVRPNRPLLKEDDDSLSTVEVVDNSFESQNSSHAADEPQRPEELTKDVNCFEADQDAADAASSSVDHNENCNYSQQTEENVSKQHILDNVSSLGKYQETKADLEDIQESERLKEESNGAWVTSSEYYENEQQFLQHGETSYRDLVKVESDAVKKNFSEHYEEEQKSFSHYEQGYSKELRYDAEECDIVMTENFLEHYDEDQPLSHYEQECSQELRYDAKESDAIRENHPDHYDEDQALSHYEQEFSHEVQYDAEKSDVVRENHSDHYDEDQPLSYYEQECSHEVQYDAEEYDVVRENHSDHYDEDQPLSHYEQEYSKELRYDAKESDAVRENHPDHYDEDQPLSHYDQECSHEVQYDAVEYDVVRENHPEHYDEDQPLSHYEQEYSKELRYDAEESDAVRENHPEHYEEDQPLLYYEQECSHEVQYDAEESDVRDNPHREEQPLSCYDEECSHESRHFQEESDTVRENTSEQHVLHYEQQPFQELGTYSEESNTVRENTSEPYEEQQHIPHYKQQSYQELGHYTEESYAVRENTSEQYEKDQPVNYYGQEYSHELEHCTEDSDVLRKSTSRHEENQPLCQEQQSYRELGEEFSQENEYFPKNGTIKDNGSQSSQEVQPIFRYEAAEFSHEVNDHFPEKSTDDLKESFSEHHKEEQQDSKQEFFQEYKQFAGTSDGVMESFSGLSEQEYQSSDDEEETTSESKEGESLSSDGESYKTTSEEDNFYKTNDFGKQHKNGGFGQQYAYYGDAMSEAAFSEVKASCSSEYPPSTNDHQYKHGSAKDVEDYEYYDDFEEDAPEMSNGYDVILALDSFNNDEINVDTKHSENFDFNKTGILGQDGVAGKDDFRGEQEVTEVNGFSYDRDAQNGHENEQDVIGIPNTEKEDLAENTEQENSDRSQFTDNIGTKDFSQSDNTHAPMQDNITTTIDCDQITCESDRKRRSDEDPSIGTRDINQSDVTTAEDKKAITINYDQSTCECDRKRHSDEDPSIGTAEDNIATNNFDNLCECDKRISPEDGRAIGTQVSSQTVVKQSVKDFSVNKKCQGSDECEIQHYDLSSPIFTYGENEAQKLNGSQYDSALPTNQYAIVNVQNVPCHENNNELQEANHSAYLVNKSSGLVYDPALSAKDHPTVNEHNSHCSEDNNELQEENHSADLLNKSSGSEYDPALPTKDYSTVNEPKQYTDGKDDVQKINDSADILNRSSSSEYDPSLPTKDCIIIAQTQTQYDDEEMQQSNRSPEILKKSSGSEYDPTLPTKDNVSSQVNHASDDIQELLHLELNKSSGSEIDVHIPTKDCDVMNEEDYRSDDVIKNLIHLDLNKNSGSETDVLVSAKDHVVTNEQDCHSDDVIQDLGSHDLNQRSGSESAVVILAKDNDVTNEQDYHSDDVIQDLRSPDLNQRSGSESEVVILAKDNDVTNEKNYQVDDVIQDVRHPDLCKSRNSETDVHTPMKVGDVTEQDYAHYGRTDNVIQDLHHPDLNKSSGSEYDPCIPTKDYDVTNAHYGRTDNIIQDLCHPDLNKSSGSEYDPHIPTKDYDVTNAHDYHADEVIQNLHHPDINGSSGSKTDVRTPTKNCDNADQDYHSHEVIQDLYHPDINKSSSLETDVCIPTNDCDVSNEQDYDDGDVPLELVQPVINESNESIDSEYEPHLQSNDYEKSDFNRVVGDGGSTGTIAEKEHYNCSPSLPEKDGMQIEHDSLDTQECIIVFCNNDKTSDDAKPSYEMILQEEYQILGAATEIFLPSDIDANHICIYQCVDFQLQRVLCPTSITGDQETSQLYHNLQAGTLGQEDLATTHITRNARNPRAAIGTATAALTRGEYAIEESRVVQNQINLIFSPISDEYQVSSQEEISCRLNVQQGSMQALTWQENTTQRTAPECESVEFNDPVEEQNPEAVIEITIVQNNVGMSADESSTSTGFSSGKSKESEKETTQESDSESDTPRADQGLFDRMAARNWSLASSKNLPTREPESYCSSVLVENTQRNRRTTVMEFKLESSDDPDLMYIDEVQYFEGEQPVGKSEDTGTGENSNRTISAEDNMSEDDACSKEKFDSSNDSSREMPWYTADTNLSENDGNTEDGNDNCKKKSPRRRQSEMMLKLKEEFRRCSQKDGQYIITSSSETSYSFLSDSNDSVLRAAQPYDPECESLTQVSLSDMSLELPYTSSASSGHPEYVAGHRDSLSDIFSESQSTSLIVPKEYEDNDLESQKPYDPANCLMDVDTFSELSGMSLDTPSSSALEYDVTEADTTLVGVVDDDSEPYTPEVYSRSPENDSEPYTPGAYSPVLSLSGDESDPELFSCKYTSDSSAYNPESHCPVDMSTSSVSGNEADNEVSTGVSSPEFSSNQNIPLSLSLKKKPSEKKVCLESYVGYSSLDKESSNDDAGQTNPEAYRPESFVRLSKSTAARRSSNRNSARVHSRSKSDDKRVTTTTKDKEFSIEKGDRPHTLQILAPSTSTKSAITRGKDHKLREENATGCKRKPLKSFVAMPCTNKRAKEDEVGKKVVHASSKTKKKSPTNEQKSLPKKKESVKRRAVSETNEKESAQDKSTLPLKKSKLSPRSLTEKRSSPETPRIDTAHPNKNTLSARRNSREEKFKKPVSPARCKTGRKSSEHNKDSSRRKSERKGSAVKQKVQEGDSAAGSSFTVLNELKSILKDIHRKSPKSSNRTKSPESSAGTNSITKVKETVDENHLLDEGHELLELALEESINRSKSDKVPRASSINNDKGSPKPGCFEKTRSFNLAEKVDRMKRKLAKAEELSGNDKMNLTKSLKPSQPRETRVHITLSDDLDNSADERGSVNAVKAMDEEARDTLRANQNLNVRSMNDKSESIELAVKCIGGGKDIINSFVVTGSKKIDNNLGMNNTMSVAIKEAASEDENVQADDDRGRPTVVDNDVVVSENVVSSAIEKQEDSKTEMHSATVFGTRPTCAQETVNERMEVNIVNSGNNIRTNKQDAQACDKENRLSTSANLDIGMSEENEKPLIADKASSVFENLKDNDNFECIIEETVAEPLTNETRKTSDSLGVILVKSIIKEKDRENEKNSCKEDGRGTTGEDVCKSSQDVSHTLVKDSVISSATVKSRQEKSSHEVCEQDREMSDGRLTEDMTGKIVITDSGAGEVQLIKMKGKNDRLSKDKDRQPKKERQDNENNEFDQGKNDWSRDGQPNNEKQGDEKNLFEEQKNVWSTVKENIESNFDSYTSNLLVMGTSDIETKNTDKKIDDQSATRTLNDVGQGITCCLPLQGKRKREENNILIDEGCESIGGQISPCADNAAVSDSSNRGVAQSPATPCGIPCIQTSANGSAASCGKASISKVHTRPNEPTTPSGLPCTQMVQTAANDSATFSEKANNPKLQTRANGPSTPSGVSCTQMVQTAANGSVTFSEKANNPKVQTRANGPSTSSGVPCTQVVQTAANDSLTFCEKANTPKVQTRTNGPSAPSGVPCTQVVQTAANDSLTFCEKANTPKVQTRANGPSTPSGVPCTQMVQTEANDSATFSEKANNPKVQTRANGQSTSSGVPCTQMVQTAANDSVTFSEKANTPKFQTRTNDPSTPSGVPCTQMAQTAANDLVISDGTLCTLKDQTEANVSDSKNSKSKEENKDPREAVSSTSAAPSKDSPKKNQKDEQTCSDSKEQDSKASDVVISGGEPMEEGKDSKSEVSLEEYIEAQLQHGLSLPDISVNSGPSSNISSKILPSLPSISFTNTTAALGASENSSFSPIKLPLLAVSSSSAMESQKKPLSPTITSKAERGAYLLSEVSKESSLANENKCQVPPKREERSPEQINSEMDIVRSIRAEYERKIIAILQKRVDVEKAYREECTSIVNAVKALARKKKNMERELGEVLQSSLREISQKYVSELQRFVRNETI